MPTATTEVALASYVDRMSTAQIVEYRAAMDIVTREVCAKFCASIANEEAWYNAISAALRVAKEREAALIASDRNPICISAAAFCVRQLETMVNEALAVWLTKDTEVQAVSDAALLHDHTRILTGMGLI